MNLCIRLLLRTARLGAGLVVLAFCAHAYADVRLPNGEYTTTIEDLKVKVIGGYVTIARSWTNGRWYANPQWADLKFTYDSLDGSVRGIDRAGTIYERTSVGLYVYKVDQPLYILKNATGWRWYDPKGNWVTYDSDGHLTAYGDRNVQVTFTLDGSGRHTQVQDQLGQLVLSFQYTGDQLTGVTDRVGRQVQYQYTGGNLTQVIDVLGNASSYTYDGNGQLTSLTDQEGHTTTIVYAQSTKAGNAGGGVKAFLKSDTAAAASVASTGATPRDYKIARVFTVTDPEGNITTYLYDYDRVAQRFTVTQKFPGGRTITSVYDVLGRLRQQTVGTRNVLTMTRDGDRTELIADERGLVTTTVFDGAWNPIKITYPDGTSVTATYDSVYSNVLSRTDEAGTQTTYQYDAKGNLTQMIEAVGFPEQRTTTYTYDPFGQRLTMTRKGATLADDATTTYTFDSYGNVATMTDAIANLSVHTFDVMGNVLTQKDPRGNTWTRTYNNRGWLTSQTDPLVHGNTFAYDKIGNRTKVTDALNNSTIFAYNKNNWLVSVTDALSGVTQFQYDAEGRKTKDIDPNNVTMTYGYDGDGRLSTRTDGNGNVTTTVYGDNTNGLNGLVKAKIYPTYTVEYKYDQRNRQIQAIQVLSTPAQSDYASATRYTSSVSYDGRGVVVSEIDPLGRTTQYSSDSLRRIISTTDATGGVTQYVYDSRDNLIIAINANGNAERFKYDLDNRAIAEIRPNGSVVNYVRDATGNVTTRLAAGREKRMFTYDAANRRIREDQFAATNQSSQPDKTIVNNFDARNLLTSYSDGTTTTSYIYDAKGYESSQNVDFGPFSKTIQYQYQPNGKKARFTNAEGMNVTYSYDSASLLTGIVTPQGVLGFANYRWNLPQVMTAPGLTKTVTYDALLRPTEIAARSPLTGPLLDTVYRYDAVGNILGRTTRDGDFAYRYDNLDRLTEAVPPTDLQPQFGDGLPIERYSYDSTLNRLISLHQPGPWIYDADGKLLQYGQGTGQIALEYDSNGALIRRAINGATEKMFDYDPTGRLARARDQNGTVLAAYYYDARGRRLAKVVGGFSTYYLYSDEGVVAEYDGTGTLLRGYGWRPDGVPGTNPQYLVDDSAQYFYVNDQIGSPQLITDSLGTVKWSAKTTAFGVTLVDASSTIINNLRMPGQYYDAETNLFFNQARYYDAETGRFLTPDPLGIAGGPSAYAYALANPTVRADPSGLFTCTPWSPDFDTSGCTRVDLRWDDKTDEKIEITQRNVYWGWFPAPVFRFPGDPVPPLPEPGDGRGRFRWPFPIDIPGTFIDNLSYVEFYYDVFTIFKQITTITTETWYCSGSLMCSANDMEKTRSMTCINDWEPVSDFRGNWRREWHSLYDKPPRREASGL